LEKKLNSIRQQRSNSINRSNYQVKIQNQRQKISKKLFNSPKQRKRKTARRRRKLSLNSRKAEVPKPTIKYIRDRSLE